MFFSFLLGPGFFFFGLLVIFFTLQIFIVCVLLCFIKPRLGNRYGPGFIPLQGTWGGQILTLHLNYVAGYTTTTQLTTRGLCPGGSFVWAGPKFVRSHWRMSWVMVRFLEIQGPNCRETLHSPLPKATLVCKKEKKTPKEKAHLHQRSQVFLISIMETHY